MPQTPHAVMLFAAGLGTRMGPLTADRPKPLVPVAGRALIDHALGLVDAAGIGRIVVNLHYRADQLRAHLAGRADIALSDESERLLETGGGLRQALPLLGPGPVFTLNTDAVWTGANPLAQLRAAWDPARMEALLLLIPRDNALGHAGQGDFDLGPDGRLRRGPGLVYTGAQIIRTETLPAIAEDVFSLNRLWDDMLARGTVFGCLHRGGWCDVGRPDCIPIAEAMLKGQGDVPTK
ncbi:MurNAc alpha-1-phosphate uridylyltransferase [Albidovulum inexpectatum]|uniref:MurNAc alpha-1-phosphate uridylyltransferase n=1 Tax=Albidovulum inexpectatum TaxID=196587 RepID=A0A2S5JN81_9RHOB|nr:nucleotidyltransferase family protein [Albidovulum inexpectatum]PPB82695.1 MurNAc alpha-1-phosphate uridylyltransferase [Albidovulum inexpectatum]